MAEVLGMDEGSGREITTIGGSAAAGTLAHLAPRCPRCKQDLALERLPELAEAGGTGCSCGQWIAVRAAPPLARVIVPGARWVVDEHLGGDDDGTGGASQSLHFSCVGCGGSLKIDGRERTVVCTWCGADKFLPDAVWQRLHPVSQVQPFTIVTALRLDDSLRLQAAGEDAHLTRDDDLPRDLFDKLATSNERAARATVAGNAAAPARRGRRCRRA